MARKRRIVVADLGFARLSQRRLVVADDRLGRTLQRIDDRRDDGRYRAVRRNGARRGQRRRSRRGRRCRRGRRRHGSSCDGEGAVEHGDPVVPVLRVERRQGANIHACGFLATRTHVVDIAQIPLGHKAFDRAAEGRIVSAGNLGSIGNSDGHGSRVDDNSGTYGRAFLITIMRRLYIHRICTGICELGIGIRPRGTVDRV